MAEPTAAEILAERRRIGASLREELTGLSTPPRDGVTGLVSDGEDEFAWGTIWSRPAMSHRTRAGLSLAMTAARGHAEGVDEMTRAALRTGWSVQEIAEILLHVQCYAGLYPARTAAAAARAVVAELAPDKLDDLTGSGEPAREGVPGVTDYDTNALALRGLRIRREVIGAGDVDRSTAGIADNSFMRMFFDATYEYCFGKVWARPLLDYRMRSMLSLSINAACGYEGAVKRHIRSAVEVGLSKEDIGEILLNVYVYGALYCSLGSFGAAEAVFADLKREGIAVRERREPGAPPL